MSENSPTTLADLLSALPEEERFILTLHYLNGRTSSEIATALGVPPRAVESVIAAGKARVMSAISKK